MNICSLNELKNIPYYHREYAHDVKKRSQDDKSWYNQAQRITLAALPLISLYTPLTFPISLAMGTVRTFTTTGQLVDSIQQGEGSVFSYQFLQTTLSIISLSGTVFSHQLGIVLTTIHDLAFEGRSLLEHISCGQYEKALATSIQILNNALYLTILYQGSLELVVLSLALQIVTNLYQSYSEYKEDRWIEALGYACMGFARGRQFVDHLSLLQTKWLFESIQSAQKVGEGRGVDSSQEVHVYHSDSTGELKTAYLASLTGAQESIVIMTFTCSDKEIIDLLVAKANEGKKVVVVIDKNHQGSLLPHASKLTLLTRLIGEGRLHHKITVIDQKKIWIGSANVSPDALTKQNNTMIYLQSTEMAKAIHEEMEVFLGLRMRSSSPLPPVTINGQKVELLLFPHVPYNLKNSPEKDLNNHGKKRLLEMINQANKSLRIAVCVWTDPDLIQAMLAAKQRGVDIEILTWQPQAELSPLAKAGIKVSSKPHLPLMHNKWMLVDDKDFINCSANWSKSWFSRNDESALILHDLTDEQKDYLTGYWKELNGS